MADKKPPKQLRITLKKQTDYVESENGYVEVELPYPLGFANVYEPHTKAYAARQDTQDNWAYDTNGCRPCGHFIVDGKYWTRRSSWQLKPGVPEGSRYDGTNTELITVEEQVPEKLQPIIIDNVPLEGFRIQHMVARHRGNKLWRILDPRGFELEITSGTFEELVMSGMVDKGLIHGTCIWRTGKMLERV